MKRSFRSFAVAATLLAFAGAACAAANSADTNARKTIEAVFSAKHGATPTEVNPTAIPGIYQVVNGTAISYMDAAGRYTFEGAIFDNKTNANLSDEKVKDITLRSVRAFDVKDAIKVHTAGSGKRVVYTFEDANCGFCKKLAPELEKVQDVTVYTFPLTFLGPDSGDKARRAWCSSDKAANWSNFLANRAVQATDTSCDTSMLERNEKLARRLGVNGTPSLFFADGSRIPGFVDAAAIETRLTAIK